MFVIIQEIIFILDPFLPLLKMQIRCIIAFQATPVVQVADILGVTSCQFLHGKTVTLSKCRDLLTQINRKTCSSSNILMII